MVYSMRKLVNFYLSFWETYDQEVENISKTSSSERSAAVSKSSSSA